MKWDSIRTEAAALIEEFKSLLAQATIQSGLAPLQTGAAWRISLGILAFFSIGIGFFALQATADSILLADRLVMAVVGALVVATGIITAAVIIDGNIFWRYDPEKDQKLIEWVAFKNYFSELAHMENEQPASIVIWENLLVYATAFGKAQVVLENMHYPVDSQQGHFGYNLGTGWQVISVSQFSSISSASTAAYGTTISQSSGSGGGGFSGGSSGGGGTGGW